ncbi:MAG: acyl carrier protein [Spirochaetales bacterium]|nr:acyl carrier protein [Spirochaetales bacterium]
MTKQELHEAIREIIADVAEIEKEKIQDETHFIEELDIDSMLALEMLARLEKEFDIKIEEEKLAEFINLKKVYNVVDELIEERKTEKVC